MKLEAAEWSAIAAICSAFAALMSWRSQQRNLFESVRPELDLVKWIKTPVQGQNVERFQLYQIRNVGRGVALDVFTRWKTDQPNHPLPQIAFDARRLPIVPSNGGIEVFDTNILIYWDNVRPDANGNRHVGLTFSICCWDRRNWFHKTTYQLLITEVEGHPLEPLFSPWYMVPGVFLVSRRSKSYPGLCVALWWRTKRAWYSVGQWTKDGYRNVAQTW
jgi:hypothetical protein